MTGWLVVITLIVLLATALNPAHRRRTELTPRTGVGPERDRDRERAVAEARAAAQRDTGLHRVAGLLASAGGAVPLHSARIETQVRRTPGELVS
jgi:hypothetical protein